MYESFYGLRERPFDLTPDPRYLVATEVHREALSNIEYAISSRKGITLLVGEAGTGKTTVIRAAISKQPDLIHCVHLNNPALTRDEFIGMLAARFDLSSRARESKAELLLELEQLLRRRRDAQETTVLIVDEAQSLSLELLEEIRLLTNIETDEEKLLTLIIAGQPEVAERLTDQSLRQLKQRIALRCELRPLNLQESGGYIAGRIVAAGGIPGQIFSREAVVLIHERSRGIPRAINVIADNALVSAFAAEQRLVTTPLVQEVCRDFDIRPSGRPRPDSVDAPPKSGAPKSTERSSARLSTSDEHVLDSVIWPALKARGEKISQWAAPAFGALSSKKR